MLAVFLFLLLGGALAVVAFSIGLIWLMLGEGSEEAAAPAQQPLSLSQAFARELEARRLWRALSSWMSAKPLRIEDRRGSEQG
jgi:hypothetical protein